MYNDSSYIHGTSRTVTGGARELLVERHQWPLIKIINKYAVISMSRLAVLVMKAFL